MFTSSFISSVVNFVIMAFILFCLLKAVNRVTSIGAKKEEPAAPTTKKCPFCMTEIDIHATAVRTVPHSYLRKQKNSCKCEKQAERISGKEVPPACFIFYYGI